jgi:hypothetical protein
MSLPHQNFLLRPPAVAHELPNFCMVLARCSALTVAYRSTMRSDAPALQGGLISSMLTGNSDGTVGQNATA